MAESLKGLAGFWTWMTLRRDFPFDAFLAKLIEYKHNFTAMAHFDGPSGPINPPKNSPALADLIAHRTERLNRHGITPLIYIFNRWQYPWIRSHYPVFNAGWIDRLSKRTAGLDLVWAACLEPLEASRDLVAQTLTRLALLEDPRPTTHNGPFYVSGADYYESGVPDNPSMPDFFNGDHHGDWLRQFNPAAQVRQIQGTPMDMGLLMVTQMEFDGEVYALPGWPNPKVANWDHLGSWQELGKRTHSEPVPPPPPKYPHLELADLIRRLDIAITGWGDGFSDEIVDRRTRRVVEEYKSLLGLK